MKEQTFIPFDLERAKAGDPVMTKSGNDVRLLCFDRKSICGYVIFGLLLLDVDNETVITYTKDGKYLNDVENHEYDLVMKPKERTVWVNVFENGGRLEAYVYNREDNERAIKQEYNGFKGTYPITIQD